ncbi:MAG: HU family DNA-binding protein [Holosporaceae bacterium]|jgi:integration host factor subunit beta
MVTKDISNLTRSELVKQLAARFPQLREQDLDQVVRLTFDQMGQALVAGRRIELRGFATFSVKERAPRLTRNPRSGEKVQTGVRKSVAFVMGKELFERLNPGK